MDRQAAERKTVRGGLPSGSGPGPDFPPKRQEKRKEPLMKKSKIITILGILCYLLAGAAYCVVTKRRENP